MNISSSAREKTCLCLFVQKSIQAQALSLGSIIKQVKFKQNNVFINKLMSTINRFNYI